MDWARLSSFMASISVLRSWAGRARNSSDPYQCSLSGLVFDDTWAPCWRGGEEINISQEIIWFKHFKNIDNSCIKSQNMNWCYWTENLTATMRTNKCNYPTFYKNFHTLSIQPQLFKLPSSTKLVNLHLLPLTLHNPDRRLGRRRSGVRLLPGRLQVWGEELLPHGGGQRGVRVSLTVCMCLRLRPLHLFWYFILRHRVLERQGGVCGRSAPGRASPLGQRSLLAPLWASAVSGALMASLEVASIHDLFRKREFGLKGTFFLKKLLWFIWQY